MIGWIESFGWHRFIILLVLSVVFITAIELLSSIIIANNPFYFRSQESDRLMHMFGPNYSDKVRKKHVSGFLASIGIYLFVIVGILFDLIEEKDFGRPLISLILFLVLPALSMQLSSSWIPIRRKSSAIIASILILLALMVLQYKKWLSILSSQNIIDIGGFFSQIVFQLKKWLSVVNSQNIINATTYFTNYKLFFILLCVILPKILIETVRYDLIFDKTTRSDYDRQYPGINKLYSLIKLFVKYQALCLLMSYITLVFIMKEVSMVALSKQASGSSVFSLPSNNVFWKITCICAVVVFLVDILRYITYSKKIYDIFISYKSDDAEVVRRISNRLISSGLNVWFAEYEILLSRRWMFQWNINKGIKLSRYALAFTSDNYAKSTHCHEEMRRLLIHLGTDKVIEIDMQQGNTTRIKFPELTKCPAIQFNGDIDAIMEFIHHKTGYEIKPQMKTNKDADNYYCVDYLGFKYLVNVKGWQFKETITGSGENLHVFECKGLNDSGTLVMNFYARPDDERLSHDIRKLDDREFYEELLRFARKYFWKDIPATPVGVHLFFYGNNSQLSLSYWRKGKYPFWSRKYSVIANPSTHSFPVEIVFTFAFMGNISFANFCQYTTIMEETAKSLKWQYCNT